MCILHCSVKTTTCVCVSDDRARDLGIDIYAVAGRNTFGKNGIIIIIIKKNKTYTRK